MLSSLCRAQLWPRSKCNKFGSHNDRIPIPMSNLDYPFLTFNIPTSLSTSKKASVQYRRSCETLQWFRADQIDAQSCACLSINEQEHCCKGRPCDSRWRECGHERRCTPSRQRSCSTPPTPCSDTDSLISSCSDCDLDESFVSEYSVIVPREKSIRRRQHGRRSARQRLYQETKITNKITNKITPTTSIDLDDLDVIVKPTPTMHEKTIDHLTTSIVVQRTNSPEFPEMISLKTATPDHPADVPIVVMESSVLLSSLDELNLQHDKIGQKPQNEVVLGTLLTAKYLLDGNWIKVETPAGLSGFLHKKCTLPLSVLTDFVI